MKAILCDTEQQEDREVRQAMIEYRYGFERLMEDLRNASF